MFETPELFAGVGETKSRRGFVVSIVKITLEEFTLFTVSFAQIVTLCCPSDQITVVIFVLQFVKVVFVV